MGIAVGFIKDGINVHGCVDEFCIRCVHHSIRLSFVLSVVHDDDGREGWVSLKSLKRLTQQRNTHVIAAPWELALVT